MRATEATPPAASERVDSSYLATICGLIRVDLDLCWQRRQPKLLEHYREQFPEVFADPASLEELAGEELRCRRRAGEDPSSDEYVQRFGVQPRLDSRDDNAEQPDDLPSDAQEASVVLAPTIRLSELRLASAAYEAFRKHPAGDDINVQGWYASLSCPPEYASLYCDVHSSDPEAAARLAEAIATMPEVGSDFLGFRLITELGQGAFARVFLALQSQLAHRPVVLKVSAEASEEVQNLAQLQHTNIVPIYSVHTARPFVVICMPYFGSTTLHDVYLYLQGLPRLPDSGKGLLTTLKAHGSTTLHRGGAGSSHDKNNGRASSANERREADAHFGEAEAKEPPASHNLLDKFTYIEAVTWLGSRLADGLAHAHERGIYHCDLKPANILLTDDGQPMLLDFNLSTDSKLRESAAGAMIGGTLPYMAPEQLGAFVGDEQPIDGRCDVYALGIVLFELLTRRAPFQPPRGPMREAIPPMIHERLKPPPGVRQWNRSVPPAVESIVRHCLEGNPSHRYQSAQELHEDLERVLDQRPLKYAPDPSVWHRGRRWLRRHPMLTRSVAVGALVLLIALGAGVAVQAHQEKLRRQAVDGLQEFRERKRSAEYPLLLRRDNPSIRATGLSECARALSRYQVFENPKWFDLPGVRNLPPEQAQRLREDVGELLLLYVHNMLPDALAVRDTDERDKELREALTLNERAEACFPAEEVPSFVWKQRAQLCRELKNVAEAERYAQRGAAPQRGLLDQYLHGIDLQHQRRWKEALQRFQEVTRRAPDHYWAWFMQGICLDHLGEYSDAAGCFTVCIVLWPQNALGYFNRAAMRLHLQDWEQALQDANKGLDTGDDRELRADLYFNRAVAEAGLGNDFAAIEAYSRAQELGAQYTRLFFARAEARQRVGQYDAAKRDLQEGMRRMPTDSLSWTTRGLYKLQQNPPDLRGAVEDFRKALAENRNNLRAWQNAAHALSIMGAAEECVRCLTKALDFYPRVKEFRSGRGIELARLGRREEAYRDAVAALRNAPSPRISYQVAGIYALNAQQDPAERLKALFLCSAAVGPACVLDRVASVNAVYEVEARAERVQLLRLVPAALQRSILLDQAATMHVILSQRNGADRRMALALLSEAIQKGFGINELETDSDLNPIRDHPEFCRLMNAVRELQAAMAAVRAP